MGYVARPELIAGPFLLVYSVVMAIFVPVDWTASMAYVARLHRAEIFLVAGSVSQATCADGYNCVNGVCGTSGIPSGGLCRSDDVCAAGLACINVATAAPPDASPYFPGVIERIVASAQVGLSATRAPSTAAITGGAPRPLLTKDSTSQGLLFKDT